MFKSPIISLISILGITVLASILIINLKWLGILAIILAGMVLVIGLKVLVNPQYGLWLILFFLPFERIPSIEFSGVSLRLNFFFGVMTIFSFLIVWLFKKVKSAVNPLAIPLWLFILSAWISVAGAFDVKRAMIVTVFTIFTIILSILVVNLLRTTEDLRRARTIIWGSAALVGIFGIYQFLGDIIGLPIALTGLDHGYTKEVLGFPRVQAFSYEPLYFGNYLLLPISLLLSNLLVNRDNPNKVHQWLLLILLIINLVLTVSRGAYLALIAVIIFIIITVPRRVINPRFVLVSLVSLIIAAVGSVTFLGLGPEQALEKFTRHAQIADLGQSESTQSRLDEFKRSFDAWKGEPVVGIGPGNYGAYALDYPSKGEIKNYPIVNNQYLETLAETGLVGFLLLLIMIAILLYRSALSFRIVKNPLLKSMLIGSTAAFIGLLVQYNFFSTLYIIHVWIMIGLLIAVQNVILSNEKIELLSRV